MKSTTWPMQIEVGSLVHWGVSSPDIGEVLAISKTRRFAKVRWWRNGVRRSPMDKLFCVTRSLTEWVEFKSGRVPCESCGYSKRDESGPICSLCKPRANEFR